MTHDMHQEIKQLITPYHMEPIVLDAPQRTSFCIHNFKTWKGALKLLVQAYRDPTKREAEQLYNEALKAHGIGFYTDAERGYTRCIQLQDDHEPAMTNLAALYIRQNSFDLAEGMLQRAIEVRSNYFRGYYNIGLLHRFMDRQDRAVTAFNKALSLKKSHFWSHVALVEIAVEKGDLQEAVRHMQNALPFTRNQQPIYLALAELYYHLEEYKQAEQCLREALKIKVRADVHFNLGWILAIRRKSLKEAVDHFREAEKIKVDFKEALFNLALMQSAAGATLISVKNILRYVKNHLDNNAEAVIPHLELLIKVNPENHHAYMRIADTYLQRAQPQLAIETLLSVFRLDPQCVPAIASLARAYQGLGRHKDAIQTYRKMIKVAPEEVVGYLGLVKAYGAIENYAAALPVIEKVLTLDPNNTEINYQYATLMAQQREWELAYKHYKMVAAIDPSYPRIQKRLKMLEDELDEDTEAFEPWPQRTR